MKTSKRTVFSKNNSNDEPVCDENLESLAKVLNWYSYEKNQDDAKNYILAYAKYINLSKSDYKILSASKERVNTSLAWISRILLNCSFSSEPLSLKVKSELNRIIELQKNKRIVTTDSPKKQPTVNVQENIKASLAEYVGEINFHLDQILDSIRKDLTFDFCLKTWLRENNVSALQAKGISTHFKSYVLPELVEAKHETCEQLTEAYSFLTTRQLNKYISVIEGFISDANEHHTIKKQILVHNKTRVRKVKSPLKQVAKLKYLKEYEQLKSVSATSMIGARAVVLYNPESRVVTYYECDNNHGLEVRGSALLNYDVSKTISKILRNPENNLPNILNNGRVAVRNEIRDLSAKNKTTNGRINNKLLILRTFKT